MRPTPLLLLPLLATLSLPALAADPPAPSVNLTAELPTPTAPDAQRLQNWAEAWTSLGKAPTPEERPRLPLRGVIGVAVTLRLEGVVVGSGRAVRADLADFLTGNGPTSADVGALAAEAADAAIRAARTRLEETSHSAGDVVADIAPSLSVETELAFAPRPLVLPTKAAGGFLAGRYAPQHEGLVLLQDKAAAVGFPGEAAARNLAAGADIERLGAELKLPAEQLAQVGRPDGVRAFAFSSIHSVRNPKARAVTLVRGVPLVPATAVSMDTLRRAAAEVAVHLNGKVTAEGILFGAYHPETDQYLPRDGAPPAEAGLVAYALVRLAAQRLADNPQDPVGERALQSAALLLKPLTVLCTDAKKAGPQPVALAFTLMALTESPTSADASLRDRLAAEVMAMSRPDGFSAANLPGAPMVKPATQALLTAALANWYQRTRYPKAEILLNEHLPRLFALPAAELPVDAHYWLALAEDRAAPALIAATKDPAAARAAHAARLAQLTAQLERLRALQLRSVPEGVPADLLGGFNPNPDAATQPTPSAESAIPTALWGRLLAAGALAPEQRDLAGLVLANRFLLQLTVPPAGTYAARCREHMTGGVKQAPWDARMNNQPTAMTLLAYLETVQGCAALAPKQTKP